MAKYIETKDRIIHIDVLHKPAESFEQLAERVAESIKSYMEEEGFDTFQEMKRCYKWGTNDIRIEICYYVIECGGDCYDDLTFVEIDLNHQMPYREFKKLVMANLK